jgi:hypothetical protein
MWSLTEFFQNLSPNSNNPNSRILDSGKILSAFFRASTLERIQFLLINTPYACGTVPFHFDLRKGKLVDLRSGTETRRYHITLGLHSLIKLLMALCLMRGLQTGRLELKKPFDLLRLLLLTSFTCLGLMDLHSGWKRREMVVATNSTLRFHEMFQRKLKGVSGLGRSV